MPGRPRSYLHNWIFINFPFVLTQKKVAKKKSRLPKNANYSPHPQPLSSRRGEKACERKIILNTGFV